MIINKKIYIPIFFFLAAIFLLKGVVFSNEIFIGGDYSLPYTDSQASAYSEIFSNTWHGVNFGSRSIGLSMLPLVALFKACHVLHISSDLFFRLLIISLFFLSGFSFFKLLIFFDVRRVIALIGGIMYITTPLFFNYTIMGWYFVLLTMALFPFVVIYFIKAVNGDKVGDKIVLSLFIFSSLQTQSIILYFITFGCLSLFVVRNKDSFIKYVKTIGFAAIIFFLSNLYWLLGLLIFPDKGVSGSDILKSAVSLGAAGNFYPLNIIRMFGSLFNSQFETVVVNYGLILCSFVISFLIVGILLTNYKKRLVLALWCVGLVPLFFYFLNYFRSLLTNIPFVNVIRDFARFSVLSTFAYIFLASLFLNFIFSKKEKKYKTFGTILILFWIVSIFPWWTGELTAWKNSRGADMRLRTKVFPYEYLENDINFSKKRLDQKALFLPLGGTVEFTDDEKFQGAFNETQDIFAGYSSVPGVLVVSDRSNGYVAEYISTIAKNQDKVDEILKLNNVNYFIVRKNMKLDNKDAIVGNFQKKAEEGRLEKYSENEKLLIYKKKNVSSHFYIPKNILFSQRTTNELLRIITDDDLAIHSAVFFEKQNVGKADKFNVLKVNKVESNDEVGLPVLEFKKINPTKYRVRVHGASGIFPMVFSESFHDGWRAYVARAESQKSKVESSIEDYKILDGNEEDQATKDELRDFINRGYVTTLGNSDEKTIEHKKWNNEKQKEGLEYVEKYNIDFVSKNFRGTIQNDNLPSKPFYETWLASSLKAKSQTLPTGRQESVKSFFSNNSVVELPEEDHLMVNGYANSWVVDTKEVCDSRVEKENFCTKNADGSYDFEMVVEFWPQRLFYVGAGISGATLLVCLAYLGFDFYRRKRVKVLQSKD